MSQKPKTIARLPTLPFSQDFYQLRRAGVGFIEQLGSRWWTDYNTHDRRNVDWDACQQRAQELFDKLASGLPPA